MRSSCCSTAFFPKKLPEQIILEAFEPGKHHADAAGAKAAFKRLLSEGTDIELTADKIAALATVKIAKIPEGNDDLTSIREHLKRWLHS